MEDCGRNRNARPNRNRSGSLAREASKRIEKVLARLKLYVNRATQISAASKKGVVPSQMFTVKTSEAPDHSKLPVHERVTLYGWPKVNSLSQVSVST